MFRDAPPDRWAIWILSGPGATAAAVAVLAAASIWVPSGSSGAENIWLPIVSFPAIWAALFMHAVLDDNLWRVGLFQGGLILVNGAVLQLFATVSA